MTAAAGDLNLIDEAVVARVLSQALKTGGEFAEVFAEDRRGSTLGLDDGRIEDISSGRERGAGIRVVAGNTTGFAHTADLSERGLLKAAEAASAAARSGGGGTREVALSRRQPASPSPVEVLPAGVGKDRKVELLLQGRRRRPGRRRLGTPGQGLLPRQPPTSPGGQFRGRAGLRRPGAGTVPGNGRCQWRHRDADRGGERRGDHGLRAVRPP